MKWLLMTLPFTCLFLFSSAPGADYWPTPEGKTYHYANVEGDSLWISYGAGGYVENRFYDGSRYCWLWEWYSQDGNGDILFLENMLYCQGWIDHDYDWRYDPDVLFLDLPLTIGKTWSTVTEACAYNCCDVTFNYEVTGQQVVTVPAGTFTTMVIAETNDEYCGNHQNTWYLDQTIGPVMIETSEYRLAGLYKLVSISGPIGPVPVQLTSWGRIKSMYH